MTVALPARPGRRRPASGGRRFGWSEGDLWTVGIGLALALTLAVSTIPAALKDRVAQRTAAGPAAPGAPAAPLPPGVAVPPPAAPAPQPLLGPLALPAPAPAPPAEPVTYPSTTYGSTGGAGEAQLRPGVTRAFVSMPQGMPGALAATSDGQVHAGTDQPGADKKAPAALVGWDSSGELEHEAEVPDQPDTRTRGVTGLAAFPDGGLAVVDASSARVLRYDTTRRTWSVLAKVPDLPPCVVPVAEGCQPGVTDSAPLLRGAAVDGAGNAFVADAGQGTIWRVQRGKPAQAWYQSADLAGDEGVAGLAFDGDGHLLAAVTRVGDLQGTGAGAVLRIERADDGAAGTRSVFAAFAAGDDPMDVAVGAGGNVYVPLRGVDAVVFLDAKGQETLRVTDDELKAPTALDLVDGRLLVAVTKPRPAIMEVGARDRPVAPPTAGGRADG